MSSRIALDAHSRQSADPEFRSLPSDHSPWCSRYAGVQSAWALEVLAPKSAATSIAKSTRLSQATFISRPSRGDVRGGTLIGRTRRLSRSVYRRAAQKLRRLARRGGIEEAVTLADHEGRPDDAEVATNGSATQADIEKERRREIAIFRPLRLQVIVPISLWLDGPDKLDEFGRGSSLASSNRRRERGTAAVSQHARAQQSHHKGRVVRTGDDISGALLSRKRPQAVMGDARRREKTQPVFDGRQDCKADDGRCAPTSMKIRPGQKDFAP